jgi:hypothetical protein
LQCARLVDASACVPIKRRQLVNDDSVTFGRRLLRDREHLQQPDYSFCDEFALFLLPQAAESARMKLLTLVG